MTHPIGSRQAVRIVQQFRPRRGQRFAWLIVLFTAATGTGASLRADTPASPAPVPTPVVTSPAPQNRVEETREETVARLKTDLLYLAGDELQGRGIGTTGIERAADYIETRFKSLGMTGGMKDGSYRQPFPIKIDRRADPAHSHLTIRGGDMSTDAKRGTDYQALAVGGDGIDTLPLIFAGYGISAKNKIKYDDYENLDVKDKAVLIIRREPQQADGDSPFDGKRTSSFSYIQTKIEAAKKAGAAAIVMVNDPYSTSAGQSDRLPAVDAFGDTADGIPFMQITQELANQILARAPLTIAEDKKLTTLTEIEATIGANLTPISQPLTGVTIDFETKFEDVMANTANVIGVIEGEGPHADETIVIGAHYDHLGFGGFGSLSPGMNQIHNGADDNASGTVGMMELARRYATRGTKPSRRMVFIAFSGEERGLLGSEHYVKEPTFPLESTIAMFNYDMLGRMQEDKLTIYGVGTAKEFSAMLDAIGNPDHLNLDRVDGTMPNSDHYPFFGKQIPDFHFFTGLNKQYHTPDDDVETLNLPAMEAALDYSEKLLDATLAMDGRPTWKGAKEVSPPRNSNMAYLGVVPDYSDSEGGLKISNVKDESPAAKGGLQAGDIIIKMGTIDVVDIQSLGTALTTYKPGKEVGITVRRDGTEITKSILLGEPKKG